MSHDKSPKEIESNQVIKDLIKVYCDNQLINFDGINSTVCQMIMKELYSRTNRPPIPLPKQKKKIQEKQNLKKEKQEKQNPKVKGMDETESDDESDDESDESDEEQVEDSDSEDDEKNDPSYGKIRKSRIKPTIGIGARSFVPKVFTFDNFENMTDIPKMIYDRVSKTLQFSKLSTHWKVQLLNFIYEMTNPEYYVKPNTRDVVFSHIHNYNKALAKNTMTYYTELRTWYFVKYTNLIKNKKIKPEVLQCKTIEEVKKFVFNDLHEKEELFGVGAD